MHPAVSVIIAAYNAEGYIGQAIGSVLNQTFQNFEVIVVDDRSSDRTTAVVQAIGDPRVILLQNDANRGPSYSRNRAIARSRGDWIAVLDADDWWHPDRLKALLRCAEQHRADLAADDLYLIRDGERQPWTTHLQSRERVIGKRKGAFWVDAAAMIRDDYGYLQPLISASLIKKHSIAYQEDLKHGEDFRFVLECLLAGGRFIVLNAPYYYYRIRPGSLTSDPLVPIHAQIRSTQDLIVKYRERKPIVRALRRYKARKELIVQEFKVQDLIRQRRLIATITSVLRHPRVIRPIVRKLIERYPGAKPGGGDAA